MISFLLPDEINRQHQKNKTHKVVPFQGFIPEKDQSEAGEHQQCDYFLDYFELNQCERTAVFGIAHAVGRHHKAIFQQGDTPTGDYHAHDSGFLKKRQMLEFQVPVPGKSHEDVGANEEENSGETAHEITAYFGAILRFSGLTTSRFRFSAAASRQNLQSTPHFLSSRPNHPSSP